MNTTPHGSRNQVVRRPATSARPAVRNSTPLSSSSARVCSMSSHTSPTWLIPLSTSARPCGCAGASGYSISSSTRSPASVPTMAAVITTGSGTSSPMSRVMASPSIRYGGDRTCSPSTDSYQRVAATTSGTHTAVWATPVITAGSVGAGRSGGRPCLPQLVGQHGQQVHGQLRNRAQQPLEGALLEDQHLHRGHCGDRRGAGPARVGGPGTERAVEEGQLAEAVARN